MSEDWFDFVEIGSDFMILYGSRKDGEWLRRELTADERERVYKLTSKHDAERGKLLRELASGVSNEP